MTEDQIAEGMNRDLALIVMRERAKKRRPLFMERIDHPCGSPACAMGELRAAGVPFIHMGLTSDEDDALFGDSIYNLWKAEYVSIAAWVKAAERTFAAADKRASELDTGGNGQCSR